jgi:ABC-type sugar transport system permease subunit
MLQEQGLVDGLLSTLFDIDGPIWFNDRWLAVGANVVAYIWKWMPFWTVIFLAARMTIPRDIYDAAEVDGVVGVRRFVHITFPLLANLYLICTLLSTLWTLGDAADISFCPPTADRGNTSRFDQAVRHIHPCFDRLNGDKEFASLDQSRLSDRIRHL